MVTIHNLEVRFDVVGENDEKVFAEMFSKYIQQWIRIYEEQRELQYRSTHDQRHGDSMNEDYI